MSERDRTNASERAGNVVLIGFMGTGKTTVGRLLADKLGWTAVGTDELVSERSGRTIPELFAERGEEAFRDLESAALREALSGRNVVATGGGAVLREANRRLMLARGWVVALTADKDTIIRRVTSASDAGTRPLLSGDAERRTEALLASRKHAYDFAHAVVDTARLTPDAIAELLFGWMARRG